MTRTSIVGAGYDGLPTGIAFAKQGHDVTLVEVMPDRVKAFGVKR